MSNEPTTKPQEPQADNQASLMAIHTLLRFLSAVRYRKHILIATLFGTCLLGGLYFFTATRHYGAKTKMMVILSGVDEQGNDVGSNLSALRSRMNSYKQVICSPEVLDDALSKLGPTDRVDLGDADKEFWGILLQKKVDVAITPDTPILEIDYQSKDPQVAVNVVNAITDAFLDFIDETRKGTAAEIRRILIQELKEIERKLEVKQQELKVARLKYGEFGTNIRGESHNPVIKKAIFYATQYDEVQYERIKLQASLSSIQMAVQNGEDLQQHLLTLSDAVGREVLLESFGLSQRDRYTRSELERSLVNARAELESMRGLYGPAHPKMVQQVQRVQQIEGYLNNLQVKAAQNVAQLQESYLRPMLIQMVQQKLAETIKKEESLRQMAAVTRNEAIHLSGELTAVRMVEHDIERMKGMGDALLQQLASLDLQHGGSEISVRIMKKPIVNKQPVSPQLRKVAAISIFAGLFLGLLIIYVLDELDDRFRSVEDMERQLRVPVMSIIRRLLVEGGVGPDSIQVHVAPSASESEAFRTLRTSLTLQGQNLQRLIVTSPEPGDGKTTISSNLGACFAQAGKRVLMLDADMRRPGLTRIMGMQGQEGLSDLLREHVPVKEMVGHMIFSTGVEGLEMIPSGARPTNPSELLSNHRMSELLDWASAHYDMVAIDSPPILAASDCAILGTLVDGIALVVRPDKSRRKTIYRAVSFFTSLNLPLLGIVLNNVTAEDKAGGYSGYGYGYGYGYDYHYGGEEYEEEIVNESPHAIRPKPTVPQRVA
ncbi:MAG: polysaccharide biosynthesis tyrosine autokinase [Planctomycetia bacterium]|jgi:capsular exopolysaccharide synthesis family protein